MINRHNALISPWNRVVAGESELEKELAGSRAYIRKGTGSPKKGKRKSQLESK